MHNNKDSIKLDSIFWFPPEGFVISKDSLIYTVFFMYPAIKPIIITFPFDIQFITLFPAYFLNSKLFSFFFCNYFLRNIPTISLPWRSLITCPFHSILTVNHKTFFRSIWNFKFRIFLIIYFIKLNICTLCYIWTLDFNCAMIRIFLFIKYII